eukprot:1327468-Pyramimonas_sp.AAC.1
MAARYSSIGAQLVSARRPRGDLPDASCWALRVPSWRRSGGRVRRAAAACTSSARRRCPSNPSP